MKYVLPTRYREEFRKPLGEIFTDIKDISLKERRVIVVGDVTFWNLKKRGVSPFLAVVDLRTQRKRMKLNLRGTIKVKNPPGNITMELWESIREGMKSGGIIVVEGEEDLAVIPCILEGRSGDIILYGQPNRGVVKVEINKESKEIARKLLNLMERVDNEI